MVIDGRSAVLAGGSNGGGDGGGLGGGDDGGEGGGLGGGEGGGGLGGEEMPAGVSTIPKAAVASETNILPTAEHEPTQ